MREDLVGRINTFPMAEPARASQGGKLGTEERWTWFVVDTDWLGLVIEASRAGPDLEPLEAPSAEPSRAQQPRWRTSHPEQGGGFAKG
jgi:hypothetical protein